MKSEPLLDIIVCGNATLDVLCYPVDDVPRHDSIAFDQADVAPGGCASNTAIGLAALGVKVGLLARIGDDNTAGLLQRDWERFGVDTRFVRFVQGAQTGVSVGLVDSDHQPRFVHTPGANQHLHAGDIQPQQILSSGARHFHISGYFVLPALHHGLAERLALLRQHGISTSLDVVFGEGMQQPHLRTALEQALPHLDILLCNQEEARRLTGEARAERAAAALRARGVPNVIVKLGAQGCYLDDGRHPQHFPAIPVAALDTTGAGDAFAAGLLAARLDGKTLAECCRAGNRAGAHVCTRLGAIAAWLDH
ncbi:MAG: carbohydrate kinase family protein [Anaerolineae bacterium]|nr:MAG: carbohydrate kinase family protein [Anaerolineae bacterium]